MAAFKFASLIIGLAAISGIVDSQAPQEVAPTSNLVHKGPKTGAGLTIVIGPNTSSGYSETTDVGLDMELAKERFKRILRRLTEFDSEHFLYKPYVKMVQGMKNRPSIVLPINIAVKLANLKPGQLPESLAWDLCGYLSRVLLTEHIEELPESDRSRNEYVIRSDLWNYVLKALETPYWVELE
ncbi:uncharacterized protein BXIN_1968 [Babesia sp. Xinjiang]|uniref:uncharacterized protein n=1 Tax=Babesia sp. Xinjiang TaxID=462227 RepID=UPI000A22563E|nr:uncharacterized protein BXIN_1968 [Babesia sp. Xinjiang]ORM40554.1 hypothetical protein BXIN_1968 [Babesia sp. Xinjiang]